MCSTAATGHPTRSSRFGRTRATSAAAPASASATSRRTGIYSRCSRRSSTRSIGTWPSSRSSRRRGKRRMAAACGADAHRAFSGRNWFQPLTSLIGRWRPDLLGAWEGGSNTTLVRPAAGSIADRHRVVLTRKPETRAMALTRMESGPLRSEPPRQHQAVLGRARAAGRRRASHRVRGAGPADLRRRLQRPAEGERGLRPARGPLRPRPSHRAGPAQPSARARTGGHRASRRPASGGSRRPRSRTRDG